MKSRKWVLLAEDNPQDAELTVRAMNAKLPALEAIIAEDGQDALDCLNRRGHFADRSAEDPTLVLLDLKMPKVDGLEVLKEIKSDPALKLIPVVIFSSSREESDIARAYEMGANGYVVKPLDFGQYADALATITSFWIELNESPPRATGRAATSPKQSAEKPRASPGKAVPEVAEYGQR